MSGGSNDPLLAPPADTIFYGATLTMDPRELRQGGVALKGGRVLAVGAASDLDGLRGPSTRTFHLEDQVLMPGFHDAHVHLTATGEELEQVDLSATRSLDVALKLIKERAARTPAGEVIRGTGFALSRWGLGTIGHAEADALQAASPGRLVVLTSQDHHSVWVSRQVLELAGVDAKSSVEDGVVVLEAGQPTGLLLERAKSLALDALPAPSTSALRSWLTRAGEHFASVGVTTVHHMSYEPEGYFRQLALAASEDAYPVRVWASIPQQEIEAAAIGLATGQGGSGFRVGGAKFFADGALGSKTAWMLEPYADSAECGMSVDGPELLAERVPLAIEAGLTPVVHAIGDAATRAVVDVFAATRTAWRNAGVRPRLEHAQHMHEGDVRRAGALGIVASMQPIHLTFDVEMINASLPDRLSRAYPIRSLRESGAVLAFGSDSPVAPASVLDGLRAAVERVGAGGARLPAAETVNVSAALQAYTVGAAYAAGVEHRSGMLRPGFDADLVILSRDPALTLDGLKVVATLKAGRFTFGEENLSS